MRNIEKSFVIFAVVLVAGAAVSFSGCRGIAAGSANSPGNLQAVNHIVFMMQENRSFDSYFGKLNDYRASAFGLSRDADDLESSFTNPADDGSTIANFHLTTSCIDDDSAAWEESWRSEEH